jgi:hypothetical protein
MADEAYDAVMPAKAGADETDEADKADGAVEANVTDKADSLSDPTTLNSQFGDYKTQNFF